MVAISVAETGLTEVLGYLKALDTRFTRQKPMWDLAGSVMKTAVQQRLLEGRTSTGTAFAPAVRVLMGFGSQTMVDSGKLLDSITHFADSRGAEWGIPQRIFYGEVLHEGKTIRAKNAPALRFRIGDRLFSKKEVTIPARPFVEMSSEDGELLENVLVSFLEEGRA